MEFFKKNLYYLLPAIILLAIFLIMIIIKKGDVLGVFSHKPTDSTVLEEVGKMSKSTNSNWWLNSGGIAFFDKDGNIVSTNVGDLAKGSYWQKLYAKNNSKDTDGGYRPQNIFRLVTRKKWQDLSQQLYFNIDKTNLSSSSNRSESNGVLLFNRYQDGDNLYYTGLRVDGDAVIKKKIDDKYYTMKEKHIFTDGKKYDRDDNPNMLPEHSWIGIKSEVKNIDGGAVEIKLYIDKEGKGDWQLVLETQDETDQYGNIPFISKGYAGIRTDFMDVKFRDYGISELK